MALGRFSSSTTTSIACLSSSTTMDSTLAGARAPITNCAGSSDHSTISTCSPPSSLRTAVTREPRMPTQVPIGSMRLSYATTAIFARTPASRAAALISSRPCSISGTSFSNSWRMKSGAVRDRITCWPRAAWSTRNTKARTRSATRRFSFGIISERGRRASILPVSTMASPLSMRLIVPDTMDSPRSRKSFSTCSRSASRIFCRMACLAACAPMRPNSMGSSGSSMYSPSWMPGTISCASDSISCLSGSCRPASSGTTSQRRKPS